MTLTASVPTSSETTPTGSAPPTTTPLPAVPAFEAPGPGSWTLDAAHCERPHSRYLDDWFPELYAGGFRAGFERIGALLDTIECRFVNGFTYLCPRPVGAPPDARRAPPKLVFKLLVRLHPALRRRVRRARALFDERPWLGDLRAFEAGLPGDEAELFALQRAPIEAGDLEAFVAHLDAVRALVERRMTDHFLLAPTTMVPVGDFVVHAMEWTGGRAEEALAALRGASPHSLDGIAQLDALADAVRADGDATALVGSAQPASAILDALQADEGVGAAARRWLERVGQRLATGHDLAELRLVELPESLLGVLRAGLTGARAPGADDDGQQATAALRARVPDEHRARFDELLTEARAAHRMRDGRCVVDCWAFGLMRRALLESGRRLREQGALHHADHALSLLHHELCALLRGQPGPSADEASAHAALRDAQLLASPPELLGPPPATPPPAGWLPGAAARLARAVGLYVDLMFDNADSGGVEAAVVRGQPASPGRRVGTARLVLSPADFERVREGDILIARITTPAYNTVLPLLGGIVTDRGGLLSHPAIVAREYGIPGLVGAREATRSIPDGARVELDGDAGTVRVLT